jgi:hypothetical protein
LLEVWRFGRLVEVDGRKAVTIRAELAAGWGEQLAGFEVLDGRIFAEF